MTPESFAAEFEDINLPLHGVRLPTFEIEKRHLDRLKLKEDASNFDFLRALSLEGFSKLGIKKGDKDYSKYADRAKYELDIIKELGFVDYMLLVWSVINYCHESKIPVGMGRGSAAGSLILYLIGVTQIDPIRYGLFFERFISRIRAKKQVVDGITYLDGSLMCDVDMDICYYNRPKVLSHLEEKFKGRTSKILTLNTLSGKLLMKEAGKTAMEKSEAEMSEVSNMIPKKYGIVRDIKETYEGVKNKDGTWKEEPVREFVQWCDNNKEAYEIALKLRNLIKNKGVHASGMMLSYDLIEESCPIELSSDKDIVSSFDMSWVSLLNVKLDCLGLRGVSVVDDACKALGIKISDIDLNDSFIYQQLQDLKNAHGLFQIEAETNLRVCQKVKPKNLEELSAVLALARPGALQFVEQYANFTCNGVYEAIHPFFDDILKSSGGVVLYQEQLMQMAHKVGFTLDEAEILRRIIGKKKPEEMVAWEQKVRDKIKENNLDPKIADILWKIMEDSANYSFNKSHSICYGALAAITVYLKFKYPQQFFLSLLKMSRFEPDPISEVAKIQREFKSFNMKLLPPHLIKSENEFTIEGNDIRFGLLSVKGISDKSIEKVNQFRSPKNNKFEVFQSAEEANLQIGILSALIQAGALDGFKQSRTRVVLEAQLWNVLTDNEKKVALQFAEQFDYDLCAIVTHLQTFTNEKGKPVIKPSRMETIRKKYKPYKDIYYQNSKNEAFANWFYENMLIGYSSEHRLCEIFKEKSPNLTDIATAKNAPKESDVMFIGTVVETKEFASKEKKTPTFRMVVKDEQDSITVLMFNTRNRMTIDECRKLNGDVLPKEDNIVIVRGTQKGDAIFANLAAVQDQKIYVKLSELKSKNKSSETEEKVVEETVNKPQN